MGHDQVTGLATIGQATWLSRSVEALLRPDSPIPPPLVISQQVWRQLDEPMVYLEQLNLFPKFSRAQKVYSQDQVLVVKGENLDSGEKCY